MLKLVKGYSEAKNIGDCYYTRYEKCPYRKDCPACAGMGHLIIELPNGPWDCDMAASNCNNFPKHEGHTCWIRTGDLEHTTLVSGCGGTTSINMHGHPDPAKNWHGFLRNGQLITA